MLPKCVHMFSFPRTIIAGGLSLFSTHPVYCVDCETSSRCGFIIEYCTHVNTIVFSFVNTLDAQCAVMYVRSQAYFVRATFFSRHAILQAEPASA